MGIGIKFLEFVGVFGKAKNFLSGKKVYILAAIAAAAALAQLLGFVAAGLTDVVAWVNGSMDADSLVKALGVLSDQASGPARTLWEALTASAVRAGISKIGGQQ